MHSFRASSFLSRLRSKRAREKVEEEREEAHKPSGETAFLWHLGRRRGQSVFPTLPHFPLLRFGRRHRRWFPRDQVRFRTSCCSWSEIAEAGRMFFLLPLSLSRRRKCVAVEVTSETATKIHRSLIRCRERKSLILFFFRVIFCPHSCEYSGNICRDSWKSQKFEAVVDCAKRFAKDLLFHFTFDKQHWLRRRTNASSAIA